MTAVVNINAKQGGDQFTPMFSVEAEQQLIGAVLIDSRAYYRVSDLLSADHFYDPVHADVFRLIAGRMSNGDEVSPVIMASLMGAHEGLQQLGGGAYLVRMAGASISPLSARGYAQTLLEMWQRRTVSDALASATAAISTGGPVSEALSVLTAVGDVMAATTGKPASVSFLGAVVDAMKGMNGAVEGGSTGVTIGLPEFDRLTGPLRPGDMIVLGGAPSMGKAQPLDALVLTPNGFRKMGEMKVGDEVISPSGNSSVVTGVFPQGQVRIMKVKFSDGREVRCCEDHLWKLTGQYGKGKVLTAKQLAAHMEFKSHRGRVGVPLIQPWEGVSGKKLPLDPWLLGAMIGNGHFGAGRGPMFSTQDAATLWRIKEIVAPDQIVRAGGYDYRIIGADKRGSIISKSLESLGLRGVRAEEKFIPDAYLDAPLSDRISLLQGLMDTDGWVEKFGAVRFSSSSLKLARQVQSLVWSIGGVCSLSEKLPKFTHKGEKRFGLPHFILNIRVSNPSDIFKMEQKRRRAVRTKPVTLGIVSVTQDGEAPAQCISVSDPDHLYVTDGYVVTHNTSLALAIASKAAAKGVGVAIVSLEMTGQSLAYRALAEASDVPYERIISGDVTEDEHRRVIDGADRISQRPIEIVQPHIKDLHAINAALLRIRVALEGRGTPLGLVLIDYLQLVRAPGRDRFQQVSAASSGIKALAMQLGVPVIALSQLSRGIMDREDKRPLLSDLRESGQIEQDADLVLFAHREAYYMEREKPRLPKGKEAEAGALADHEAALSAARHKMEVICAKKRMGRIGTCSLGFDPATNRIWSPSEDRGQQVMF